MVHRGLKGYKELMVIMEQTEHKDRKDYKVYKDQDLIMYLDQAQQKVLHIH